ncbi:MAG: alpha-amylase [Bacteroidales bacterium]|nr:alpha-amylase [Bacteroidales bacterium]
MAEKLGYTLYMTKHIIYQVLPRLWGKGKFSDWDRKTFDYLKWMGVSAVWYTGVLRHARGKAFVKGEPGSPYAITDYYDVNPYLADDENARMEEFESLLERTHKAGLKAIIDFVPNHVARDYHSYCAPEGTEDLGAGDDTSVHWRKENDFFYYPGIPFKLPSGIGEGRRKGVPHYTENPAKASGNCFTPHPGKDDWYETVKLNYCPFHTGTWDKMYRIVRFWAAKGVDGFRCDMVELVPPPFFKWMIARIKEEFPQVIFIAEVYDRDGYRTYLEDVGFDLLYHKTGFYDTLRSVTESHLGKGMRPDDGTFPPGRPTSASVLTSDWQHVGALQDRLLNFLENHDEQRIASDFYAGNGRNALASLGFSLLFNRAPFMLYFGQEIGERGMDAEGFSGRDGRTSIFDFWQIDSIQRLQEVICRRAWKNGSIGELTDAGLSVREAELLLRYQQALRLSVDEAVFREGDNYDLGWCQDYNRDEIFAFLRCLRDPEGKVALVVCNFSARRQSVTIHLPKDVCSYCRRPDLPDTLHIKIQPFDCSVLSL